ncbi:MAG: hypothetical protein KKD86_17775 [Bacteroidetes bacterium]|nr:hypothetical protein [Bacteroidota bacterium]MBU1680677.1 hypothetical protein [Bacteroidota bacterium]
MKNQKTLSKILKPEYFDDDKWIKKGLLSCILSSNTIDEKPVMLAKIFFEIENAELTKDLLLLAIRKFKYNLITQNISKPLPSDNYSQLKINKPKRINLINSLAADWQGDEKISAILEEVLDKLAQDVSEEQLVKLYGIETEYGIYNRKITVKILSELTSYIDYNPDRAIALLISISPNLSPSLIGIKEYLDYLIRCANIYKILNSLTGLIFDRPKNYIEEYVEKYHQIVYNYRKALLRNV